MERPATTNPASAREIIIEIVRNMREGLEPLQYSTLAPAIYHVYLHPDDLDRLRGIVPKIVEEAKRALDAELEALNRGSFTDKLRFARKQQPKISAPDGGWQIRLLENNEDDTAAGDIVIFSELAMPQKPDYGAGSMTKRVATRRMGGRQTTASESYAATPILPNEANSAPPSAPILPNEPNLAPVPPPNLPNEANLSEPGAVAVLEYEDRGGRRTYHMTKNEIVVGRGGRDYWTDLKLETAPDISREHFRLRRDPNTGKFFLKDLSRLGTTINGEKVASSVEIVNGEKRDRNLEAPVPEQARIGLADVLFLDFHTLSGAGQGG
jgi:hypothetical protein